MTKDERISLTASLVMMREMFPESKIGKGGMKMYREVLEQSGYSLDVLNMAMRKALETAKFFPRVSDILEAAKSIQKTATNNAGGLPTSGEAWEEIMKNARHEGNPSKWKYSCPAVEKAAKRFGTMEILLIPASTVGVARSQFIKIYEQEAAEQSEEKANRDVMRKVMGNDINKLIEHVAKAKELE